jgi:hypothetical protein
MEILSTISSRVTDRHKMMDTKAFHGFLRRQCTKELNLLKDRAASYASSTTYVPSLTVADRKERISAYENMDFCDDFETYCKYYDLPFHSYGEVHGAKMLQDYVESLGAL